MAELISADHGEVITRAAETLKGGGTVVLPTDTVYGIAAHPQRADGVDRIFELKQRPAGMHLAVLVADATQLEGLSADRRPGLVALADAFWPGALTIVVGQASDVARGLGADDGTIGVRCPDHDLVRQIAAVVGPIATTSANLHGELTPPTAPKVASQLPGVDLVVDGGVCPGGVASTVVSVVGDEPVVLRAGPISEPEISAVWSAAGG